MNVTFPIPDDFARRFGSEAELGRRALEALAVAEYRAERLSKVELRHLLGFETRWQLDDFLHEHGVDNGFTFEEIEAQLRDLRQLGI